MVVTRSTTYQVACNWKLFIENGMEDYHTATVHRGSIGAQKIDVITGEGNWEAGFFESEKTIATLPGETAALPFIPTLSERAKRGTYFVLIYPCANFACNQDGAFWIELYPRGPARTDLILRFAFPRATVVRPDFEQIVQRYYHRCSVSVPEDIEISEIQQRGLSSPLARSGRVSLKEVIVHSFANWLLDRVLGDPPSAARKPLAA
jgi:choline monooxygenase